MDLEDLLEVSLALKNNLLELLMLIVQSEFTATDSGLLLLFLEPLLVLLLNAEHFNTLLGQSINLADCRMQIRGLEEVFVASVVVK